MFRYGKLKSELRKAAYNQEFVESAPVVFVCCGDLLSWKETRERNEEILKQGDIQLTPECESALMNRVNKAASVEMYKRTPTTLLNVAIAIEHIVLEAVELGLGSCWVRLFDEQKVKQLLSLPENLVVVALLPVGVPNENPKPRPRLPLSTIVLPIKSSRR